MRGVVLADHLNVHKDPAGQLAGLLKRDDQVEIITMSTGTANWWYVCALDKSVSGWVDKKYIQLKATSSLKPEKPKPIEDPKPDVPLMPATHQDPSTEWSNTQVRTFGWLAAGAILLIILLITMAFK